MPTKGRNRTDMELDSWTNYVSCRWIDNSADPPLPNATLPDSPDLFPESEPSSSVTASRNEAESSEEDLASVPSTVNVGSPGTSDGERTPNQVHVGALGETWTEVGALGTLTTTTTRRPLKTPPGLRSATNLGAAS